MRRLRRVGYACDIGAEGKREARAGGHPLDDAPVDVRERQEHQRDFASTKQVRDVEDHLHGRDDVGVRDRAPLGHAGGSRGVDDRREVAGLDCRGHMRGGFRARSRPARFHKLVEASPFHYDAVLEIGQPLSQRVDALQVGLLLADDGLRAGVRQDVYDVVGRARRVHRYDHRAEPEERPVAEGPLEGRAPENRDAIAFLDAQRGEAGGRRRYELVGLGKRDRRPLALALEQERLLT